VSELKLTSLLEVLSAVISSKKATAAICRTRHLDRLVMQRLTVTADTVREEDCLWVELMPDAGYSELSKRKSISKDVRKELKRLCTEYDELVEALDDRDDADEETNAKLDGLQKLVDELTPPEVWPAKAYTTCGAIVRLDHDGLWLPLMQVHAGVQSQLHCTRRRSWSRRISIPVTSPAN